MSDGKKGAHGAAGDITPAQVARVWSDAARLRQHPEYSELLGSPTVRERVVAFGRDFTGNPPMRWTLGSSLAAVVLVAVCVAFFDRSDYSTRVAEIRELPLSDGSVLTLGAKSELDVRFTETERTVRLDRGEAFFSVAHNAARPFVVIAGDMRIRVVGTQFNVAYDGRRARVTVLKGEVQVTTEGGKIARLFNGGEVSTPVRLLANQRIEAEDSAPPGAPETLQGTQVCSWCQGRLDYQDAPLSEIVADANRYYHGRIVIATPALGAERLTTSFGASQIDEMLDTLSGSLSATVERRADGTVELARKHGVAH